MIWVLACHAETPAADVPAVGSFAPASEPSGFEREPERPSYELVSAEDYVGRKSALVASRDALAARYRAASEEAKPAIREEARRVALDGVTTQLFPAWYGTDWDFNGITEVPREGSIACGYFVSTTLRDAGFEVERYRLAQQGPVEEVRTLATDVRELGPDEAQAIAVIANEGESLWVLGLDFHVGFLWNDGARVWFCNSDFVHDAVECEDPATSLAFGGDRHLVGRLLDDDMVDRWLTGRKFETVLTP